MKNLILTINIITYLMLFLVVFVKLTDKDKNSFFEKLTLFLLMIWSLFLGLYLTELYYFKNDKPLNYRLNFYEIITKIIVIFNFVSKIKDDNLFQKKQNNDKI